MRGFFMTQRKQIGLKSIGILLSYLSIVLGVYFFDWSPTGIFLAFYFELIILILVYVIVRIIDERKHPAKYRKLPPALNILFASIPLLAIQFLFIVFVISMMEPTRFQNISHVLNETSTYFTIGLIIAVYIIDLIAQKNISDSEHKLQQNVFLEILALSGTNVIGLIAAAYIQFTGTLTLLILMLLGRAAIEIYFKYKTSWT